MIEFKGELTGEAKKFLSIKKAQTFVPIFIITALIWILPAIWLSSLGVALLDLASNLLFLGISVLLISAVTLLIFPRIGLSKSSLNRKVFIDLEEQVVVQVVNNEERFHLLDTVEKVFDYGEYYWISFRRGDKDVDFIIQKNLLTTGTLEEFEALFDGKIERKFDSPKDSK